MKKDASNFIVVRLMGGLGNQMFQYACGRALSIAKGSQLYLDTSWYTASTSEDRPYLLGNFPVKGTVNNKIGTKFNSPLHCLLLRFIDKLHLPKNFLTRHIREPHFHFWRDCLDVSLPAYLDGYWQSEKYFRAYANFIREDFIFPESKDKSLIEMANKIVSVNNAVSVHVRRGDYPSNPNATSLHYIDFTHYYQNSLLYLRNAYGKMTLFMFSDDPEWVRRSFDPCGHTMNIIDLHKDNDSYYDMYLMSLCKHHIIANSSFSWWGAWLSKNHGETLAPSRWFADPRMITQDLYVPNWRIIPA